jgi:hypothetical protein
MAVHPHFGVLTFADKWTGWGGVQYGGFYAKHVGYVVLPLSEVTVS